MVQTDKDSAIGLAVAFLRKSATKRRFLPAVRRVVETDARWICDFYHPRWHELRRRGEPFGSRIAVDKKTGKTEHYAALRDEKDA